MSNLLALPFKKTYSIDIKAATRQYISEYGAAHPDEFREDIRMWQELRREGVGGTVHENQIDAILLYHAQLVSILTKLPTDIKLTIPYTPAFNPSALPISCNNLMFERASILFNLAALYSQLAAAEDRSSTEGIKRAANNYQHSAGTLAYLNASVLPKLVFAPDDEEVPLDLSSDFVKSIECLMLAQAQECTWQLAKLNQYRNSLVAKIAARVSSLYGSTATMIREAPSTIKHVFPSDWYPHIEAKQHHFAAVAEYRESMVEYEASRYGAELGRLGKALSEATQAYEVARKGKIATSVLQDAQSLLETVRKSETRAQRDNDLIYHQDVPTSSGLPALQETNLVSSIVSKSLMNPTSILGNRPLLFNALVGWGAREAINIYNNNKQSLIQDKIIYVAQELQDHSDEELRQLNLPSSLEALERPVGLPPSLLRKAEEVRLEDGPAKIEASIQDVQRLAHQDLAILEEALDILDNEASEDEAARKDAPLTRLRSHEANVELIGKSARYRSILVQAGASDESVRKKWDEWEESIVELTLDEATLEISVPSSTVSTAAQSSPQGQQTRQHARALRVKLEELDTLSRDRDQLVHRARALAAADDIQERILNASAGFERLAEVQPAIFEDVLDEELSKFDKFLLEMGEIGRKQSDLLQDIQNRNKLFLDSRRDDPAVKEREVALQSLDLAYFKYREITRNLEEGFKFYNDLAGILTQFKEVCKEWSLQRNQELHTLTRPMQKLSLRDHDGERQGASSAAKTSNSPVKPSPPGASRKTLPGKSALRLPALDSSEWEFEEITLPPGPGNAK